VTHPLVPRKVVSELEDLVLLFGGEVSGRSIAQDRIELISCFGIRFEMPIEHSDALISDKTPVFDFGWVVTETDFRIVDSHKMGPIRITITRSFGLDIWPKLVDVGRRLESRIRTRIAADSDIRDRWRRIFVISIDDWVVKTRQLNVEIKDGASRVRVGIVRRLGG